MTLPADARSVEALEWVAEEVSAAGGDASLWVAEAASGAQERAVAARMAAAVSGEYLSLVEAARAALCDDPGVRRRTLGRLRRQLHRIEARDYFLPEERTTARDAVEALTASLEPVT